MCFVRQGKDYKDTKEDQSSWQIKRSNEPKAAVEPMVVSSHVQGSVFARPWLAMCRTREFEASNYTRIKARQKNGSF